MLGGRITNQDEDEVEDELAALEKEVNGPAAVTANPDANTNTKNKNKPKTKNNNITTLPAAPDTALPETPIRQDEEEEEEDRTPARTRQQAERKAMLAS